MDMWPWQVTGVNETIRLLEAGELSICVTSPTGMGKGRQIEELARYFIDLKGTVILFTNRKMLTRQTGDRFLASGITFGYATATHGINTTQQLTVASVQTIASRVKREVMELPKADLLIVDEAHNKGFDKMIEAYEKIHPGTAVVGYSATPVGLKGKYAHLVAAGTKADGRKHGALVPCHVIAPSEPDMKGVAITKTGEYVHKGMVKRVMECTVFADVLKAYLKNAKIVKTLGQEEWRPTLLWAPGVPESRGFVEQLRAAGITAEHIDGDTEESERDRIAAGSKDGSIRVVSSFGVLREGIDWPWISYGILVQVCGAYHTFLQTVGRILRASPETGKVDAILQDHSGTWWRHGSPNWDHDWKLGDTSVSIAKTRKKNLQAGEKVEGICCPKCAGIRQCGPKCPHCGYEHTRSVRMVRTVDGELVKMVGSVTKKKKQVTPDQRTWQQCLYACGASGRTLAQARGLYYAKTKSWPKMDVCKPWPQPADWDRQVGEAYPKFNYRNFRRAR